MISELINFLQGFQHDFSWTGNFVNGKRLIPRQEKIEKISYNPSTGEPLFSYFYSIEHAKNAIETNSKLFLKKQKLDIKAQISLLKNSALVFKKYEVAIKKCLQVECGVPEWESNLIVTQALTYLKNFEKDEIIFEAMNRLPLEVKNVAYNLKLHPVGPAAAYLSFSNPVNNFIHYFTSAVIAGCPISLFASPQIALTTWTMSLFIEELGLPVGSVNIILAGFEEFKNAIEDERIKAIIYSGSKDHCDVLRKGHKGYLARQIILQSGGKNCALIHSSADLSVATKSVIFGAFRSAGQLCSSTSRVFIYRSMLPEFIKKLLDSVGKLSIGETHKTNENLNSPVVMGPLYSKAALEKFLLYQTMANRNSLETIYWGREIDEPWAKGYFVSPGIHLMEDFDPNSSYQNTVLFSPDIAIYPYDVLSDAIEYINSSSPNFVTSFFGDQHIIEERCQLFQTPNILVNSPTTEFELAHPLPPRSHNSHHRYHGINLAFHLLQPQVLSSQADFESEFALWP